MRKKILDCIVLIGVASCGNHGDGQKPSHKPKDPMDDHLTDIKIRTEVNQADICTSEAELGGDIIGIRPPNDVRVHGLESLALAV